MAESRFKTNIDALIGGMESFLSTKTVVGEPMDVNGTTIIPLAEVSFGMGAGAFEGREKHRTGGGIGAKITPSALLVINDSGVRVISAKDDSGIFGKLLEMVPELINKFIKKDKEGDPVEELFEKNENKEENK